MYFKRVWKNHFWQTEIYVVEFDEISITCYLLLSSLLNPYFRPDLNFTTKVTKIYSRHFLNRQFSRYCMSNISSTFLLSHGRERRFWSGNHYRVWASSGPCTHLASAFELFTYRNVTQNSLDRKMTFCILGIRCWSQGTTSCTRCEWRDRIWG